MADHLPGRRDLRDQEAVDRLKVYYVDVADQLRRVDAQADARTLSKVDEGVAIMRDNLARYGVDLDDPVARDATFATIGLLVETVNTRPHQFYATAGHMQAACVNARDLEGLRDQAGGR